MVSAMVEKVTVGIIGIVVVLALVAGLAPEVQSAGDDINDTTLPLCFRGLTNVRYS